MTATAQAEYKAHARIIKALAHPTRLFIVDELSRGERCVFELTEMIGVEMPTVSRHLGVLRNVGIMEDKKRGAQVFYRLRVPCVLNFFQAHRSDAKHPMEMNKSMSNKRILIVGGVAGGANALAMALPAHVEALFAAVQ